MIAKLFTSFKKTPLLALLNSKRLEISPKNGWRARVLARRSFSEVGAGEPMTSFPNWRKGQDSPRHTAGAPLRSETFNSENWRRREDLPSHSAGSPLRSETQLCSGGRDRI